MKNLPPCPNCGAGYPTVQLLRKGKDRILCCTHCAISGKMVKVPAEEADEVMRRNKEQLNAIMVQRVTGEPVP